MVSAHVGGDHSFQPSIASHLPWEPGIHNSEPEGLGAEGDVAVEGLGVTSIFIYNL